jgi:hypothetical protein
MRERRREHHLRLADFHSAAKVKAPLREGAIALCHGRFPLPAVFTALQRARRSFRLRRSTRALDNLQQDTRIIYSVRYQ